jgi:hypothetical protein
MEGKRITEQDRLIVFGRYPIPGQTKTRLIPGLGRVTAADFHRHLFEQTLNTAKTFVTRKAIDVEVCHEGSAERKMRNWLGGGVLYSRQGAGDLGARMEEAFARAFQKGCRKVLLFGTDIPGLSQRHLSEGLQALNERDLVLGPSTDGGYWLIGLKSTAPAGIFRGMAWGAKDVLEKTIARAKSHGMTVHILDSLTDMDTMDDLKSRMPEWLHSRPYVSVIMPVLNEAANIEASMARARDREAEIIVVDGGSVDQTVDKAIRAGARVLKSAPGRALQQNTGAAVAQGKVLLFLHADTKLPEGYVSHVFEALLDPTVRVGAFFFRTDLDKPLITAIEWLANFRTRYLRLPYGDQALFVRKSTFEEVGGIPVVPIAEDLLFVKELSKTGKVKIARAPAVTSGRRWEKLGVLRTTLINQMVLAGLLLRVSPHTLARLYRRPRV